MFEIVPAAAVPPSTVIIASPSFTSSPTIVVPIAALRPADSPRLHGVDPDHIRTLAEAEAELPPILVHRPTMRVVDGMHRLGAAELRGEETIAVQYVDGTEEDTFLLAVETNIAHGLPLTLNERRAAAGRIICSHPGMSDRSIAAVAGLAAKTVAAIRRGSAGVPHLSARIGRDGRLRPLNSAEGRRAAGRMFVEQPDASLRRIAREVGISVGTARDVRERIRRGEDPTRPRRRGQVGASVTPLASPAPPSSRVPAEPVDHDAILMDLRRDPSLRYTDAGRSLLRWLGQRATGSAEWRELMRDIPPHCAIVVARVARSSAMAWTDFANALDQRVRSCDVQSDVDDAIAGRGAVS